MFVRTINNLHHSSRMQCLSFILIFLKKKESAFKNHWIYEKTIVEPKQGEKNILKRNLNLFYCMKENVFQPAGISIYLFEKFIWFECYMSVYVCLYLCVCVSVFGCIVWACPNSLFFHFSCVASELRLLSCFITSVSFIYILMHFAKQFFKMYHLWKILHIAWINSTTKKQKSFKSPINCISFIAIVFMFFFWMFNLYYL